MHRVETKLTFTQIDDLGNEGANSDVFLAKDNQLGAEIVVKAIKKSDFTNQSDFFNESKILYSTQHPNISEIHYACEDDDCIYLSMPYYKKGSLNSLLNERFLTVGEIIKYSLDFLNGLHYIHTKKLIHFDIKPSNILINNSDRAVVTDFGLAKYINSYGFALPVKTYKTHKTPEAIKNYALSSHADIYQAGLTLYRMCNGNDDFKQQRSGITDLNKAIVEGKFPNRKKFLPHIPNRLRTVIKKAISVDIKDRYDNILEMINEISKIDSNLNWGYNYEKINRTHVWVIETDKVIKSLELLEEDGVWKTVGTDESKTTGKKINNKTWNTENKSIEDAFKSVEKIISDFTKPKKK